MENLPQNNGPARSALIGYFIFKILPLLICGVSIYLGYRLFILGVSGQASLSINSKTISGQLLNAAPGLFFAVGGLVGISITVAKGLNVSFSDRGNPLNVALESRSPRSASSGASISLANVGGPVRQVELQAPNKDL
jgi:hypothetical protein